MNRQTYPVLCSLCGSIAREDGPVPGTHTICPACADRARGMRNATPWTDEAAKDRRTFIEDTEPRRPRPNDFIDGFLIGGAVAILLGILAEYIFHLHKL